MTNWMQQHEDERQERRAELNLESNEGASLRRFFLKMTREKRGRERGETLKQEDSGGF